MGYGKISSKQWDAIGEIVKGKTVHDIGCGDLEHARGLIKHGASKVIAIDKNHVVSTDPRIEVVEKRFHEYRPTESMEVAFLSFPVNYDAPGLLYHLATAKIIIYIGNNFNGTACGIPMLFHFFVSRKLISWIPNPRNTLLVIGEWTLDKREPTPEEMAGIDVENYYDYYDHHK